MKFTAEQVQYNKQEFKQETVRVFREVGKALLVGTAVFLIGVFGAFCLAQLLPRLLN